MEEDILKGKTLLVVDDEVDLRDIMASELEYMGAKVFQAGSVRTAKEALEVNKVDLIVSDIRMPGGTGIDLLDYVKSTNPSTPAVILITGFADIIPEDAFNKGAEALLSKPFLLDDLILSVEKSTMPASERYVQSDFSGNQDLNVEFLETIEECMASRQFLIGRGGVAFLVSTLSKKIESSDPVNFNFTFKNFRLKGSGICRWVKVTDRKRTIMGLEFMKLDQDSYNFISDHWHRHQSVPFIPSLVP